MFNWKLKVFIISVHHISAFHGFQTVHIACPSWNFLQPSHVKNPALRRLWNRLCRDHRNPVRLWEARGTNPFVGSGWSLAAVQRGEITGIADILRPRKLWMLWLLIELRGCWFLERFDSFRMLHVHLCNLMGKPEKVDGAKHDPIRSLVLPPGNGRTAMEGTPSTTPGVIRAMHPWKTLAEWRQAEGNPWASWIRHPGSARDMKGRRFPSCWRKLSGWLVQLWKPLGSIRILHNDPDGVDAGVTGFHDIGIWCIWIAGLECSRTGLDGLMAIDGLMAWCFWSHPHFFVDRSQGGLGHCCQSWRRLSIPPLSGQWGSNGRVFSENSAGVCGRSVLDVSLI